MTERTRNGLITGVVLAALAVLIVKGWSERGRYAPVVEGAPAPSFTLRSLAGERVSLESLRGQIVLLNFWATWCPPCRWEMPAFERLHQKLGDEGLEVVAVNVDAAGSDEEVEAFVRERDLTFTILRDPDGSVQRRYDVRGLPTTFLIGPDGRILRRVVGAREWDEPPHSTRIRRLVEG